MSLKHNVLSTFPDGPNNPAVQHYRRQVETTRPKSTTYERTSQEVQLHSLLEMKKFRQRRSPDLNFLISNIELTGLHLQNLIGSAINMLLSHKSNGLDINNLRSGCDLWSIFERIVPLFDPNLIGEPYNLGELGLVKIEQVPIRGFLLMARRDPKFLVAGPLKKLDQVAVNKIMKAHKEKAIFLDRTSPETFVQT